MELSKVFGTIELANPSDKTFTINDDEPFYVGIQCNSSITFNNTSFEIMLNEGSTAINFIPYYNYTLMKDDYITEDCVIHHKRNQVVLDGTEKVSEYTFQTDTIYSFNISSNNDNTRTFPKAFTLCNIKSTHFIQGGFTSGGKVQSLYQDNLYFSIDKSIASTVAEVKEWLAGQYANGTPVIIEYETSEEITETIPEDTTLYNQVKELYRTIIQVPTINIETESDEDNAQLIVNASAIKSS